MSTARPLEQKVRGHMHPIWNARRSGAEDAPATDVDHERSPSPYPTGPSAFSKAIRGAPFPPTLSAAGERRKIYRGHEPRCVDGGLPARKLGRWSKRRSLHHPVSPNLLGNERPRLAGVLARRLHRRQEDVTP